MPRLCWPCDAQADGRLVRNVSDRAYISIALLANRFDVKWVMSQVGHADSKMTLDVYAQLEQRVKREHGVRFDALVRSAQAQLHGAEMGPEWDKQDTADSQESSAAINSERTDDRDSPR